MSDQSDYARAVGVNHPDDIHETRKIKVIRSGVPMQVRWIETIEVLIIVIMVLDVALKSGWL